VRKYLLVVVIGAKSSAIFAAPVPKVSTPSEGIAQIAWIC